MKKNIAICLFLLLGTASSHALTSKEILEGIRANYEGMSSFEMQMEYKLYKGVSGFDLREQYVAEYKKEEQNTYRRLDNFEFITTPSGGLTINHRQKQIILSNPEPASLFETDYKESLKQCSDVQVTEDKAGLITLKLRIKEKTDLPYSAITLTMDKNFWISSMICYYSAKIDFSESYFTPENDHARLEITFSKLKDKWKDKDQISELSTYVSTTPEGIFPAPQLADYTVYDYRTNTKN